MCDSKPGDTSRTAKSTVVLVHGLWVNGWDMLLLQWRLHRAGYITHRFSYPTVRKNLSENAATLNQFLQSLNTDPIHLVAHSLGGLVLRQTLHDYPQLPIGRVVTLASPHRTSLSAYGVSRVPWLGKLLLGKSIDQGVFAKDGTPWGPCHEWGSVAGTRSVGLGRLFAKLPLPNDGTVTVEETQMEGLQDHIVLPVNHMGMSFNKEVAKQVMCFLETGHFEH
ncbi:MAG: putative lipase [Gammaproteobacteria bacterium]|nr:putative lipase [Gammaproteobacteria bacterium]MDH5803056.1 putative lipase [Gammaproteobacteria bacterium]